MDPKDPAKNNKQTLIQKIPLDDPENKQTLCTIDEYPQSTLNNFSCGGDYLYFSYNKEDTVGLCYYRVNIETGEREKVFESNTDAALVYRNEQDCLIETLEVTKTSSDSEPWDGYGEPVYYRLEPGGNKAQQLTETDYPILSQKPTLYGIDDTYTYFGFDILLGYKEKEKWPEQVEFYACTQDGKIAATLRIPSEKLDVLFEILPGNEEYVFVRTGRIDTEQKYYYARKSEFDGGTVELKEIPMQ